MSIPPGKPYRLDNRSSPSCSQPSILHRRTQPPYQSVGSLSNRLYRVLESMQDDLGSDPEIQELRSDLDNLRQNERNRRETSGEIDADIVDLEQKLQERRNRRGELQQRMKDLAVTQSFLSTAADSLPWAEAIKATRALNDEIFLLTSIVADKIQVAGMHMQEPKRKEGFRNMVHSYTPLAPFLGVVEAKHLDDPLAIQLGWRAMLVEWCATMIQAWTITSSGTGQLCKDLDEIYAVILSQNDQAVAGRWRALCFGAAGNICSEVRGGLPKDLIRALVALPALCGYIGDDDIHENIANAFEQRIGNLLDKCLELRRMIGERITSVNIRPYFFNSGERYDPASTELDYEDDDAASKKKRGIIACSLSLGLYLTHTLRGDDGKFVENRKAILKPKVILLETLKEVIA